jgi:putative flavoprotein involved in K+ transport
LDKVERVQTVVVGGGQAGLATAYELKRRGLACAVLEADARVGDQWRRRWDSLHLFTPARLDALPGSVFPAPPLSFPSKDQMADYLEAYSRDADLPVQTGVRVLELGRAGAYYRLKTTAGTLDAEHVVVATGYDRPKLPAFAADLRPSIRQLHAADYRNPSQLTGSVLVVGAGTSGVDVALDSMAAGHRTILAGRDTGSIPPFLFAFGGRLFWFFATRVATLRTPIGRRLEPRFHTVGAPLIRPQMDEVLASGVERAPRVSGVVDGLPILDGGRRLEPDTIVWCTGYRRDYSWIEFEVTGSDGHPRHAGGVVEGERGLYFVGLPFQTRFASHLVGGVGADAAHVAGRIAERLGQAGPREDSAAPALVGGRVSEGA